MYFFLSSHPINTFFLRSFEEYADIFWGEEDVLKVAGCRRLFPLISLHRYKRQTPIIVRTVVFLHLLNVITCNSLTSLSAQARKVNPSSFQNL